MSGIATVTKGGRVLRMVDCDCESHKSQLRVSEYHSESDSNNIVPHVIIVVVWTSVFSQN